MEVPTPVVFTPSPQAAKLHRQFAAKVGAPRHPTVDPEKIARSKNPKAKAVFQVMHPDAIPKDDIFIYNQNVIMVKSIQRYPPKRQEFTVPLRDIEKADYIVWVYINDHMVLNKDSTEYAGYISTAEIQSDVISVSDAPSNKRGYIAYKGSRTQSIACVDEDVAVLSLDDLVAMQHFKEYVGGKTPTTRAATQQSLPESELELAVLVPDEPAAPTLFDKYKWPEEAIEILKNEGLPSPFLAGQIEQMVLKKELDGLRIPNIGKGLRGDTYKVDITQLRTLVKKTTGRYRPLPAGVTWENMKDLMQSKPLANALGISYTKFSRLVTAGIFKPYGRDEGANYYYVPEILEALSTLKETP